ncbi:MAG: T9SS type A sorting domain-containing protein [Flavobacteriaceae bacterium]|nr:T9SS type A sorting domain-containing protein [Flavobacteriaceae bacterium]
MKRFIPFFLLFSLFLFSQTSVLAQHLVREMSLSQQVSQSEQIIEGEVIKKKSVWNATKTKIYTVNTIKIYKTFKGQPAQEIEVITPGGRIGLMAEVVTPSLKLYKNQVGLFFLERSNENLSASGELSFEPYGSLQGFFHYDLKQDKAANLFKSFEGISENLYSEITALTGDNYIVSNQLEKANPQRTISNNSTLAISNISPNTATAGTKTLLTIEGSGFGSTQWKVAFPYSDTGGSTYVEAFEHQIQSWTTSKIIVEIPSFAGTGPVRVETFTGTEFFSDPLTISYAHINLNDDDDGNPINATREDLTQMINEDGTGGYTWLYNTEFNSNVAARESFRRAFDQWVCDGGVNWKIGGVNGTDNTESDGINLIRFDNGAEIPSNILGRATSYFNGCAVGEDINWFVVEYDIIFNDGTNWQYGPAAPTGNQIDFETVAIHELGHAALLAHIIEPEAIMHYALAPSTAFRTLSANDILGAEAMMNRSVNDPVCGQPAASYSACSLSTEDLLAKSISIYPNPANKKFSIKTSSNISIESISMHDVLGKRVLSSNLNSSSEINIINVDNLSPGVYFARIISEQGSLVKKVIIE